jgi:Family of unknown function (DUF5695)
MEPPARAPGVSVHSIPIVFTIVDNQSIIRLRSVISQTFCAPAPFCRVGLISILLEGKQFVTPKSQAFGRHDFRNQTAPAQRPHDPCLAPVDEPAPAAVFLGMRLGCHGQRTGTASESSSGAWWMPDQGLITLDTPQLTLKLVRSSQTVAALLPKGADGFDFTPGDRLVARSRDGYYHLGDLDLRLRVGSTGPWQRLNGSCAQTGRSPILRPSEPTAH